MTSFNDDGHGGRRVAAVTGTLDQALAACLDAILADARIPALPSAADPAAENRAALLVIAGNVSTIAPTPYITRSRRSKAMAGIFMCRVRAMPIHS